jgi:thiamine biosynthesis lipoprotein
MTSGAFDVTVGPLVDLWGFGPVANVSTPPADDDIELAKQKTGLEFLQADCANAAIRKTKPGIRIDLSGYGKGRAADDIGILLSEQGIFNFLVEIGGDLRAQGKNAKGQLWRVAIERPDSEGRAVERIIQVDNTAVATSGDYRNFFEVAGERYSHTIDPRTGRPVTHDLASVTVLFDNAAIADGYATALMVLGPDAGMALAERRHIAAYFLVREGDSLTERMSPAFNMLVDP